MTANCCPTELHERLKLSDAWWLDQRLLGFTTDVHEGALAWRNCRACESTLARHCAREEMSMSTPDDFWLRAEGYAKMADEAERAGHLDLAMYFDRRVAEAAVARFDHVCVPQLVDVHAVPDELTEVLPAANPWIEQCEAVR